jgi:WD40 repeat protein
VEQPDRTVQGRALAFSPDGHSLAALRFTDPTGSSLVLINATNGEEIRTVTKWTTRISDSFVFSPVDPIISTASEITARDQTISLWNSDTAQLAGHFAVGETIGRTQVFSPDGRIFAMVVEKTKDTPSLYTKYFIKLWDWSNGQLLRTLSSEHEDVMSFSPDGKILFSAGHKNQVKFWDPASSRLLFSLNINESLVNSMAVSPDGRMLAFGGENRIYVYDLRLNKMKYKLELSSRREIKSLVFSSDGEILTSAGDIIQFWDMTSGKNVRTMSGGATSGTTQVAFSPDGRTFAVARYAEETIGLWDWPALMAPISR